MWIKKLLLILLLWVTPAFAVDTFSFRIVLAGADTFTIPIAGGGAGYTHNFTVHWDDGEADSEVTAYNDGDATHSYAGAGTYDIIITGTCEWFCFNNAGDKTLITALLSFTGNCGFKIINFYGCSNLATIVPFTGCASVTSFYRVFFGCTSLVTAPANLFDDSVIATNFSEIFYLCTALTSIPNDLFKFNILANTFAHSFTNCHITAIPDNLFAYCPDVTTFLNTFFGCSLCTSIGTGVFANCADETTFQNTIYNCTAQTSLPANLFADCVLANTFNSTFYGCNKLTTINSGIFDNCAAVTTFYRTFFGCSVLVTIPANMFDDSVLATNFIETFYIIYKLQQNSTMFFAEGGESTRFLNQSVNFSRCFFRASFTGTQGTAPAVWTCDFGSGTPTSTDCFAGAGNSLTSLTNYNSIPIAWGGTYVAPAASGQLIMIQEF